VKNSLRPALALAATAATVGGLVFTGSGAAASAAAPENVTPPVISGTPAVGRTLTTSNGSWTNSPTSYSYQWLRCNTSGGSCVSIAGANEKTYALQTADGGRTIRVNVTAKNADGSAYATSAETNVVSAAGSPRATDRPIVSGTPEVGEELSADEGSWSGTPTSFAYQWQRCDADNIVACTNVPGATAKTYTLHIADEGYRLRVGVTAKNDKGSGRAFSAPTAVVRPALKITNGPPRITLISARFLGATLYARFRVCDDSLKNLTIIATDSRPGKLSYTRRFSTLSAPNPCGVYTRHWVPAARFRGAGRYTVTLRARDTSGSTSAAVRRNFSRG
jgi:Ig domain of plant-specific actin-binding protein